MAATNRKVYRYFIASHTFENVLEEEKLEKPSLPKQFGKQHGAFAPRFCTSSSSSNPEAEPVRMNSDLIQSALWSILYELPQRAAPK